MCKTSRIETACRLDHTSKRKKLSFINITVDALLQFPQLSLQLFLNAIVVVRLLLHIRQLLRHSIQLLLHRRD